MDDEQHYRIAHRSPATYEKVTGLISLEVEQARFVCDRLNAEQSDIYYWPTMAEEEY